MSLDNLGGNPGAAPQVTQAMLKDAPIITCDCGGMIFTEKLFFKKLSLIVSPTGKEEMVPMPILVCEKCGKVPTMFDTNNILPKELLATKVITK